MSRSERLFTPKSLARVAEAVEWEDVVETYKDGTTNQEQYMKAMAILYERWMRNWSIPDFAYALQDLKGGNFLSGLQRVLSSLENRVIMVKGFYEGLWAGANPGRRSRNLSGWMLPTAPTSPYEAAEFVLGGFLQRLRDIVALPVEESEGAGDGEEQANG